MALTTATIIALGGAAIGGSVNLVQAQAARDRQRAADTQAGRLLADARAKIEKDFYEGLKLPTEAYDQAYEANAQAQRESVEALQQADARSLAAGVGRVGALANENTQKIRAQQAQEMFELDKLKAEGKENMTQQLAAMDVAAAQDMAKRAAQADEQVGMLQAGAAQSIIGGITAAAQAQPLNKMSKEDRQLAKTFKKNKDLFAKNNISRSEFLANPSKYQNILNPTNVTTPQVSLNYTPQITGLSQRQSSPLSLNYDATNKFNFTPNVNYGFSFADRMASLPIFPSPQLNLTSSFFPQTNTNS